MTLRLPLKHKDPDATLEYAFDLSEELDAGRSLAAATFALSDHDQVNPESPLQLTILDDYIVGNAAIVWLSGGTLGRVYRITCTFTDDASPTARVDDRSMLLSIGNR